MLTRLSGNGDLRVLACNLHLLALLGTLGFGVALQFDLAGLDDQIFLDLGSLDLALGLDALLAHLALGLDLGGLGLTVALGLLCGDHCGLLGARGFDLALLRQRGELLILLDGELLARGLQVLGAHLHLGVLLHIVALLAAGLGLFRQAGQALGIEGVVGVKELLFGLVQAGQRDGFQLQAVLFQVLGNRVLNGLHEVAALVLQFLDGHRGGGGAQRIHKLVFHQRFELFGAHGARAQGLGGDAHRFFGLLDAHEEGGRHVHAHAILGDQALFGAAHHF